MALINPDDFDGYRKWLGVSTKNRIPTHYELLGISLDEDDPDVIQAAAEQRRNFVESKRGEGHDELITEILYRIDEAESTLLNTALRRDYDRKMNLFEKRRKSRQVDPVARRSGRYRGGRTVGEDGGIVKTFAGIVAIVCVAFGGMAWFGFRVQPKPAETVPAAPAVVPAAVVQQPIAIIAPQQQQVTAERKDLLNGINVNADTLAGSWTLDGGTLVTADNSACNVFLPLPDNESYRLEIEATRTGGNAGLFVNISSFGSFSAVCIDRGLPHKNPLPNTQYSGLANIDGRDAAENPSKTLGTAFQTGNTATIVIEVRPRHISATVDGRSVVDWRGALSRLSGGKPRETGLGTWTNEGRTWRFSKIVLSKLSDHDAESPDNATAKAKEAIQGEWLCVASEEFGKTIDEENVKKQDRRTTINGNDFTMLRTYGGDRGGYVGKFQIDASNGHFDFNGKTPDGRPTKWIGIYELDGETLKLCFWDRNLDSVVRPTNFKTPCVFHTYKRIPQQKPTTDLPKPVLQMTFDENQTPGVQVELHGAKYVDGKVGKALEFDGSSFAVVNHNLPIGNASRSLAVWLKDTRGPLANRLIHPVTQGDSAGTTFGIMEAAGKWRFFDFNGGLDSGFEVDMEWHHHCVTTDGATITYYFDGVKVAEVRRALNTAVAPLMLGTYGNDIEPEKRFVGLIDELMVFDVPLTQKQIQSLSELHSIDGSDRFVAEWVISKGGNVIVRSSGESVKVFPQGRLPTGDIALTEVYLVGRSEVVDEDIRRLVGLRQLTTLSVAGTSVTDNAMKDVGEITSLTTLSVAATSINGSGFEHLGKLESLSTLLCGGSPIIDASLRHLTHLPELESLGLIDTQVTDAGMQAIASIDKLKDLRLAGTKVTDDGLNRLMMLKSLKKLLVSRTLVSKNGVAAVRAALPQCEVTE